MSNQNQNSDSPAPTALVHGKPLAKWPQDLYIPPDALEIFLEAFQGPLDLLLYLIRRQNIDILDIPVAHITRQYMEYVELMRHLKLDLAAEYLLMAAVLAEIKSRMLLPTPPREDGDEEEEDPRAALVRRLQEYERFGRAAQELAARPRLERELFLLRAAPNLPAPAVVPATATLNDLLTAFRDVLERSARNKHWRVSRDALSVREKMAQILARLQAGRTLRFEALLLHEEGKAGLVVSFMAVLELVRDRMLVVVQEEPFAAVHVRGVE